VTAGEIASIDRDNVDRLSGGFIHFFTYQPGFRRIAQRVLEECEHVVARLGPRPIRAFCGYSYTFYHVGTPCLSDRLGHVYALLKANGYGLWGAKQIFLGQEIPDLAEPTAPEADVEVTIDQSDSGRLPGLAVRAVRDGVEIGICEAESAGRFCMHVAAQECSVIESIGVDPDWRRMGWGRYLLQRTLFELKKLGYRTAVVGTTDENVHALLLYTSMGFRVVHRVHSLMKDRL